MRLRDWLDEANLSIKSFAEAIKVERAMVYRYFAGAMPRAQTIRRIELLTDGAVTAQDFYDNAMRIGGSPGGALGLGIKVTARASSADGFSSGDLP